MEVDEIRTQNLKRSRIVEMERKLEDLHQEDDEDDGGVGENRLRSWHSSRIFRVSRTSGGKDRHSKVLTSKGLRDRRVRLSVSTAIQFYDLQDRLGYDQPSKAVEWLINAASDAIAELPPLNTTFQNPNFCQENEAANYLQKPISLRKSTSSSPSEASKGSVLSLSQPEMPLKTRTQERTGKEEENESLNLDSQGSFTELLIIGTNENKKPLSDSGVHSIIPGVSSTTQFGNPMHSFISPLGFAGSGDQNELHRYSFIPDQLIPSNNFSVSSSISGFNRGTLQSNSSSPLLHCQKLPTSLDGPHFPFFLGTAPNVPGFMVENQFPVGFDGRLQLYCDNSCKGKGKS